MSIKKIILGKKGGAEPAIRNPYVSGAAGRKEWNDRYENLSQSISHWKIAFFCAIALSAIFGVVIAKMATQSSVQPFVVETNQGMPYAIKPMASWSSNDQRVINFAVNQFIFNARTVVNDAGAEKTLLNKVYAYSANSTINFLHDYYEKNNPLDLSSQFTISVTIVNSLPISPDTWQITWDETKRATSGDYSLGVTRWMAHVTYKFGDVNPQFLNDNPFGFYITHVAWSQSQVDGFKGEKIS